MLRKKSVENFLKELKSAKPAPGGGSVSALAGALAAGLALMAINITLKKTGDREIKTKLIRARKKIGANEKKFLKLMDKDAAAFMKVIAAFKLPRITAAQKKRRSRAIQTGYKAAASAPLETAMLAFELKKTVAGIKNSLTEAVSSDIRVAEFLAGAAFAGAFANVTVNLPFIGDEKFKKRTEAKIQKMK